MGVGDYEQVSWAYDGLRCQAFSGAGSPYGVVGMEGAYAVQPLCFYIRIMNPLFVGDVIGVALDCEAKTIGFYHNGKYLGVAFADVTVYLY